MPTVAIVGRPNVGKSALFNRLAKRRIAIVHDQPGVTRDRISAPCMVTAHPCTIVDTGGIGSTLDDGFAEQVTLEADIALETADLILFVVDGQEGLTTIDEALAQKLRKAKSPVLLIINKVDHEKHDHAHTEMTRLGLGNGLEISAEHGRGFAELTAVIDEHLAPLAGEIEEVVAESQESGIRLAIVGKPNAGKSSLVNAIVQSDRTIVSDIAGTTRDAIDLPYQFKDEKFTLVDTAGLRPRTKRDESVEVFSAMRTEKAIRRADICLLVVDLASGVSAQDRKIAQLILKEKKPCLIVLNKFDLFHPGAPLKERQKEAKEQVRRELFFLHYAPFVCVSAKEGTAVTEVLAKVLSIKKTSQDVPSTGNLNRMLQMAFEVNPPPSAGKGTRRLKLYYATTAVNERYHTIPVPTFVLFVNDKSLSTQSYEQYLSNRLREVHPAPGIPVVFSIRSRRRRKLDPRSL
ncbi:ribosome biogenesis GTPase Der [Haloferula rosea]|uniref:GTPase Der n=1 Tax=Haloferula rosea TaxID=490093 RepID=A0A934VBJ9_9BACT|nr:ribosome biogenesis GTPase Der [Haloferula rosea]MBK1827463.1 ribosome biogenesis GTPase Der [Haloferula rosea]